jgi:diguanylate cyclase (GGDEF)-like protein
MRDLRRPDWLRPFLQPVTYLGLGASILVIAVLLHLVAKDRDDATRAALRSGDNLTRLFEGYVIRTIGSADQKLLFLRDMYQRDPARFSLAAATQNPEVRNELTFQFTIAGPDGIATDSSFSPSVIGAYRGDQEAFRAQVDSTADALFISRPLQLKSSGKWAIVLSRRLATSDGAFAGVIALTLDPFQLQKFYSSLDLGADGMVSLLRFDGTILTTGGTNQSGSEMLGRSIPGAEVFQLYRQAPVGSYWNAMQLRDSVSRLISYRVVEQLPLIAIVGISEHQIFKAAGERARFYFAIGAAILIAILSAIAWGVRRERITGRSNMLLEQALTHMPHGVCMFGADKRLKIANSLYATMYGLRTDQTKPGTTLLEILQARIAAGSSPRDAEKYIVDRLDEAFRPEPARIVNELRDGRVVAINRRPMPDGGSVAIHQDITTQKRAEERIAHLAHYDGLTGLSNRVLFLEHVENAARDCRRSGQRFAVHLLDLDRFKEVNDSLGHAVGDSLLKEVARRLLACVGSDELVARLGGDEFTILQHVGDAGAGDAKLLAEKILRVVEQPFDVEGHHLTIETSVGVALAPDHGLDADELLKKADLALYRAKADGRNGWRLFESDMEQNARSRLALAMDLRKAIARQEFELHYQPVVSTADESIVGAEALIRWRHPGRGIVSPGDFIPLAEDTGLVIPLGEWVLRRACADAAGWPSHLKVAVNLSPVQFRAGNLVELVKSALSASGLPAGRLEIEVTESVLLRHNAENLRVLHELQALGVAIVLDDFGTGYSSMSYLLGFPFSKLKIDREFVAGLSRRRECAAIVSAAAGLAKMLDMAVTAEGIETAEQLALVRAAGCGLGQGYLFGSPAPMSELNFDRTAGIPRRSAAR